MKIEISIWGIRRGFEKEGFFHTHNNAAIKASQQDRFRNICNNIGNKGFFNIQHIQGKTIVSYIDSGVREYLPTGPRPGYAVFSLIIPSQDVFEQSPRAVLLELSHFYRSRVGESNQNNFNSAEIEYFLNKLKLVPAQNLHIREQVSAYAYYADAAQIDHFLTGNIPFAAFGELLFIPSDYNPATGKYKEIEFIDDSLRSTPQMIDLRQAEAQFMRERENEIAKQREEEKRKKDLQQQQQFLEQDLINMLKHGKKEEALQKFEQSPLRSYINPAIAHQLNQFKQEQEVQNKSALLQQQDERLVSELLTAHRKGDMDLALANYKKLSSKNHANLTQDITRKLEQYDADSKQLRAAEEQQRVNEREQDGIRAKRKKNGVYFILLAMVALIATSFFLKQPTFIWDKDADGVYNWSDECPDKSGLAKFNGCPDTDKDGIPDAADSCKNEKGNEECQGCPDDDGDGIKNSADSCKNEKGTQECHGCPDRDEDGVADKNDKCPNSVGNVDKNGCPTQAEVPAPVSGETTTKWPINTKNYPVLKKVIGLRFIKLVGTQYEFSEQEFKGYKKITDKTQISALNKEFGLTVTGGNTTGTTPVSSNPTNGGTNRTGGTNTNTNTSSGSNKTTTSSNKKEYPDKAKARNAFSNWEKEEDPKKKVKFKNVFLGFNTAYFDGVTSGKYAEDKDFEKFLRSSMKKL